MGVGEILVAIETRRQLPYVEVACLAVDDDNVRPVEGEADRGRNRAAVRSLLTLDVRGRWCILLLSFGTSP